MSPHHKRCGIILYHPTTGKYLLVRGIDSKKWGFPKGHMEWGEIEEQTAIREFEEETGLTVRAPFDHRLRFGNNVYFVKTHCEERQPSIRDTKEIDDVQWFTLNEIMAFPKDQCNFGLSMWRKQMNNNNNNDSPTTRATSTSSSADDTSSRGGWYDENGNVPPSPRNKVVSVVDWFNRISIPRRDNIPPPSPTILPVVVKPSL